MALIDPITEPSPETAQDKLFDYQEASIHLKRLIGDWKAEVDESQRRRDIRDVDVDVKALRETGRLDEDETLIPVRVIDTNITREQPPYVNYLKNSRRLAIFRSLDNPDQDTQLLEQEFTRGMTYTSWEISLFKCVDGAQVHGWDMVEVVYDPTKPLNCGIEHIGHDQLFFPRSVKNLQQSPRIIRKYDVTILQLKKWVGAYGFNATEVNKLIDKVKETQKEAETISVYKLYFKKDDVIYVAWFSENDCDDWLKAPSKLYLGIRTQQTDPMTGQSGMWIDADITEYPIFRLAYRITEKQKEVDNKGRVFLDENKQEAQTAVLSGFVNGITRASNLYASPGADDGTGSSLKELDIKLKGGRILNKPINFWKPEYPDAMILNALQYFDVANSQETNQVNFAAMNREDSRKTATEIGAATQQQTLLNSVQLTLFSTFIREVYSFCWKIVQSQALQNKIKFLMVQVPIPQINPITGQPIIDLMSGQPAVTMEWQNNIPVISQSYEVRAAGDVDVVQRQEKINMMMQDWPVISMTILRDQFLADLVKLKYPDSGERYAQILGQQNQMNAMQSMIGRLSTVLQGSLQDHPDMMGNLPAQQQADLQQMLQEAQSMMPQQQPTQ
jgi:hypothetical protein